MNALMFLVYTVFGSNTLAYYVQHPAAVRPNNIVNCNRFDVNKHCVDGNKVLSSHSNKSVTSSADSRVNKVSNVCNNFCVFKIIVMARQFQN